MGVAAAVGDGESFALGPIAELPDHELELADAAELPLLRALLRIAQAVMRVTIFDEALEVIAEQTLLALGAASVPISRWEPHVDAVRTLINAALSGQMRNAGRTTSCTPRPVINRYPDCCTADAPTSSP